ncbi:unnamed protein product [Sphenostylis stenocarpa]|uniref:Uncharacterized protein n=1 Tax=Sphenostylis stenocarpa TaxID=92480 RepID=A0AA86W3E5_9FABA|nr:unnamed protein product [Sphenostylis stenocarpa]
MVRDLQWKSLVGVSHLAIMMEGGVGDYLKDASGRVIPSSTQQKKEKEKTIIQNEDERENDGGGDDGDAGADWESHQRADGVQCVGGRSDQVQAGGDAPKSLGADRRMLCGDQKGRLEVPLQLQGRSCCWNRSKTGHSTSCQVPRS